ncbi:hypothetical protein [Haloferula sargassicola]|uniref:TonB C-terminal domain-containing protein n=1 Tax=Haloferula sargassicola TaxID=490096 RepID=A0ABP9UR47_9BACT
MASALAALLLHLLGLAFFAVAVIQHWIRQPEPPAAKVEENAEAPLVIVPMIPQPPAAPAEPAVPKKQFARTTPDQAGPAPEDAPFIGENDTRAAGDLPADATANPLTASQQGIDAKDREMETTESDYQDGDLAHRDLGDASADPMVAEPTPPNERQEPSEAAAPRPASREKPTTSLATGPDPIDVATREAELAMESAEVEETPKEKVADKPREEVKPKPQPVAEKAPGFRGNQQRVRLKGAISRSGKPALDVNAGPLGRYHAALSRAIEKSWQRAAVRNRDFITPGVLRVQVVLDPTGKVRTVGLMDEVGTTTIQRGFTFSSIREADLPEMPEEVRRELNGEPLELLYNFIF